MLLVIPTNITIVTTTITAQQAASHDTQGPN
jgi:hypothetical protein